MTWKTSTEVRVVFEDHKKTVSRIEDNFVLTQNACMKIQLLIDQLLLRDDESRKLKKEMQGELKRLRAIWT